MKTLYPLEPKIKVQSDFYVFDTETGSKSKVKSSKFKAGKSEIKIKWELEATSKKFIFGVVYGKNYTKVIHSIKQMRNEFKKPRYKRKKVFAHNFGRFDGSVLFDNIFTMDSEAIFIGSRFISATNGNCTFGDSLNIYKASVKEIGIKMGKLKLGMDEGNYKESLWPRDKAKDINGCIRDCEIIWDALLEIFEEAGDIKLTIGSLAMTYFRRFAQDKWIVSNDNVKYFWESYYGGRTEAFKMGKTHSQVIDVNSLYPDRMKNIEYPNPKYLKYEKEIEPKFFNDVIVRNFEGCAMVTVYHPDFFIGLLPCRIGGKLVFPVGRFSGVYNFNELRFAIDNGITIERVDWICYSEKMQSPFINFVDRLALGKFLANSEGRALDEWKYKYLMNNLFGKFSQRIDERTIYIYDVVEQYDLIREHQKNNTFIKLIPFNSERVDAFLVVKSKKLEINYSIPSFSSYITSAGRVKLAEKLISMKENKPVYCDTDSIFFEVNDGIQTSNVLGEWKLEDKIVTEIRGLKNYSYVKNSVAYSRIKGVPSKAVTTDGKTFNFNSLVGTKEGLRRGLEIGVQQKRTKLISGKYEKRIVLETGETKPINI